LLYTNLSLKNAAVRKNAAMWKNAAVRTNAAVRKCCKLGNTYIHV